jgi:hypothetical protein
MSLIDPARIPRRFAGAPAAEVANYTGPAREIVINTETKRPHLQDGLTQGGVPLARLDEIPDTSSLTKAALAYASRAEAEAANIPVPTVAVRIAGYADPGDGGGAVYKRLGAAPNPVRAGHFQSADGAWWELAEAVVNVKMLGVRADGTDETARLQAALDWRGGADTDLVFPSGYYKASGLTWAGPGHLGLQGAAGASFEITTKGGTLFTATGGHTDIEGFTVYHPTAGASTGGYFFDFANGHHNLARMKFFNGYGLARWGGGCGYCGATDIVAQAMRSYGFVVDVSPNVTGQQYGGINFRGLCFQGFSTNVGAGLYIISGDTVIVSDSNIAGFNIPILIQPEAARSYLANLFFTNVLADGAGGPASTQAGWHLNGTNQYLARVFLNNCWSGSMASQGVYAKNVKGLVIAKSEIIGNKGHGILIDIGCRDVTIDGCIITGNGTLDGGNGAFHGVVVAEGVEHIGTLNNRIGRTNNGTDPALRANTQGYGVFIQSSRVTQYRVIGNDLTGNRNRSLQDLGGGVAGTTKVIANNTTGAPSAT